MLNTGKNITGDQLYSAIYIMEELHQSKTINLPIVLEIAKERELLFSKFMWKNSSPVMIVSFCLKPVKNVLLVSTTHSDPDLCNKPVVIDSSS